MWYGHHFSSGVQWALLFAIRECRNSQAFLSPFASLSWFMIHSLLPYSLLLSVSNLSRIPITQTLEPNTRPSRTFPFLSNWVLRSFQSKSSVTIRAIYLKTNKFNLNKKFNKPGNVKKLLKLEAKLVQQKLCNFDASLLFTHALLNRLKTLQTCCSWNYQFQL